MVSSPGAGLEGILGCAVLSGGWGAVLGLRQGRESREWGGGAGRLRKRDPGPKQVRAGALPPSTAQPRTLGPPGLGPRPPRPRADLRGEGQGLGSHRPGSGGGRELMRAERWGGGSLELSPFTAGMCVRVVTVVLL